MFSTPFHAAFSSSPFLSSTSVVDPNSPSMSSNLHAALAAAAAGSSGTSNLSSVSGSSSLGNHAVGGSSPSPALRGINEAHTVFGVLTAGGPLSRQAATSLLSTPEVTASAGQDLDLPSFALLP